MMTKDNSIVDKGMIFSVVSVERGFRVRLL